MYKHLTDYSPGAGAVTKDFELAKAPIGAIILRMYALGSGAAGTAAHFKTQFGTFIYVKDGDGDITPRWSLTELYEYHKAFFNRIPPFQDGTAADNKAGFMRVIIPFGRPAMMSNNSLFPVLEDPLVGWNPKSTPILHVEMPADSDVDARTMQITVLYRKTPFPYTKKWTDWTSLTLNTTGLVDWIVGDNGKWLETFLFQTSEENATLTSDAPSIKKITFERGGNSVVFDGQVFNPFGALLDSLQMTDDQYLYWAFSHLHGDPLSKCINLSAETKIRIQGGVADAVKCSSSVIKRSLK